MMGGEVSPSDRMHEGHRCCIEAAVLREDILTALGDSRRSQVIPCTREGS